MGFVLGKRSLSRLEGLHPDLKAVVMLAIQKSSSDFTVVEGVRTKETQKKNILSGASKTMRSRHIPEVNQCQLCCAVDIAPMLDLDNDGDLDVSWAHKHFDPLAKAMKEAAKELGVPIEWGMDLWGWDAPHFQLPWAAYP